MKAAWAFAVVALGCIAGAVQAEEAKPATEAKDEFQELFNGKDLEGWEGLPDTWRVEDGILLCESTPEKPCTKTHYLYWTGGQPVDFELRAVFRMTGEGNSGVQFRSTRREDQSACGPQADLDAVGFCTGCLYHDDRFLYVMRGERAVIDAAGEKKAESIGDADELFKALKVGDWNEYRIVAKGPHVALWINDTLMCEVEDHAEKFAPTKGEISVQMHQGTPMRIEFKSIKLRELGDESVETSNE